MSSAVLAEYWLGDDESFLFVIAREDSEPRIYELELTRDLIRSLVSGWLDQMQSTFVRPSRIDLDPLAQLASLVAPLKHLTSDVGHVWFVPHDALHQLPLHAVAFGDGYLADSFTVSYTPSASVMNYCSRKRRRRLDPILILADASLDEPLPHARQQGSIIAHGGDAAVSYGTSASLSTLFDELARSPGPGTVHLACHGRFDLDEPTAARIELSDGDLTIPEIMSLRLDADLVTLCCCQSGLSVTRPGDELMGLTRAFIYAGASSVLVSLWVVDELSSSIIMDDFYAGLRSGLGVAESLGAAQLSIRSTDISSVVDRCNVAARAAMERGDRAAANLFREDLAQMRYRAGDYGASASEYESIIDGLDGDAPSHVVAALSRIRRVAARGRSIPDYSRRPYDHPYYWAPFMLVGEWR